MIADGIIQSLMLGASLVTGIPVPDEDLAIVLQDRCTINQDFHRINETGQAFDCTKEYTVEVEAYFDRRDNTIHIRDTFDEESDKDRSTLLHEIVHFLANNMTKAEWTQRFECVAEEEKLAYDVQEMYLTFYGLPMPVDPMTRMIITSCNVPY